MRKLLPVFLFLLFHQNISAQSETFRNIGQRTLRFKDEKRNRPIITEIWYPTSDSLNASDKKFSPFLREYTVRDGRLPAAKLPLILVSHGTGGNRLSLEWIAQHLVRNGYIVAAVDHWGNTTDNKIPLEFLKPWERPQDISFALTQLQEDDDFRKVIDDGKIGALGFSFGGYTVIALAGGVADYPVMLKYYRTIGKKEVEFPEFPGLGKLLYDSTLIAGSRHVPVLKDSRIKAFFAICPGTGPGFVTKQQFIDVQGPVFIIGAQSDSMAPVNGNAKHYHQLIDGSTYYEFPGKTGHYVMLAEAIDEVRKEAPIPFADDVSVDRHAVHMKVNALAVDFFKQNLKD